MIDLQSLQRIDKALREEFEIRSNSIMSEADSSLSLIHSKENREAVRGLIDVFNNANKALIIKLCDSYYKSVKFEITRDRNETIDTLENTEASPIDLQLQGKEA